MIKLLQQALVLGEIATPVRDFFYNEYIIEVFGGVILSIMTLALIWFLRPKVIIAPHIATDENNGVVKYYFKVINKSYLFQLVDVNFELTMLRPVSTPRGMNLAIKHIDLKSNQVWFLSRRKLKKNDKGFATYAIVITVDPDKINLHEKWKDNEKFGAYFDLKVIAKNNFSGITSIKHEKFNHISCIKKGKFCHGNSLKIENGD